MHAMIDSATLPIGCEAANIHISQPIPSVLWHYTSFAAMQGIVTSKTIWASEYRFLNDEEEFLHAKKLADSVIDDEPASTSSGFRLRDELRKIVNLAFNSGQMHEERLRIMVASFSAVTDQLSQWRGYAGGSTGVSIGLDLRHMRAAAGISTTVTFAPCLYKASEKRALLKAIFAECSRGLEEYWDATVKAGRTKITEGNIIDPRLIWQNIRSDGKALDDLLFLIHRNLQYDLLRIAPLLKNESFSEEEEWRLVLPIETILLPTNRKIEFRATSNSLIPYVAYPLLSQNQEGPIHCTQMIVGPGSHPSATIGVSMFLARNEIPTPAMPSQVPYRPK
jgi:hypothetical protein